MSKSIISAPHFHNEEAAYALCRGPDMARWSGLSSLRGQRANQ